MFLGPSLLLPRAFQYDDKLSICYGLSSYMQNQVASSAVHEGTNRLAEGPNQNIELAREHIGSEVAGIGNSVDVESNGPSHGYCKNVSLELWLRSRRSSTLHSCGGS